VAEQQQPASSRSEMQYEKRRVLACDTKESVPRFMPSSPAVATPSGDESYAEDMQLIFSSATFGT